jgi:hypothetical protein
VSVESGHELWLFRVNFQMCSTRRHICGCSPCWYEIQALIVPALISSNLFSKFICRVGHQRLECSPWIRNFFTVRSDCGRPEGGSSTEFCHCEYLTESFFHQFPTHFRQLCNILSRNRRSFVQRFRYCLGNLRRRVPNTSEVTRVYFVAVTLTNPIFHRLCSISLRRIDCRAFLANLPLTLSVEAIINSDGHLGNAHISNADI